MFTLVEPLILDQLLDYPHLGCAMLIAACHERSIATRLVKGQTWYLPNLFIAESEELWNLICDLKVEDLLKVGLKEKIREFGLARFQAELKTLYMDYRRQKNPRQYFSVPQRFLEFLEWHNILTSIYLYYLKGLQNFRLGFVEL